jgi:hypothetical protein
MKIEEAIPRAWGWKCDCRSSGPDGSPKACEYSCRRSLERYNSALSFLEGYEVPEESARMEWAIQRAEEEVNQQISEFLFNRAGAKVTLNVVV